MSYGILTTAVCIHPLWLQLNGDSNDIYTFEWGVVGDAFDSLTIKNSAGEVIGNG